MAFQKNNRTNGNVYNKLASTVYNPGDFVIFNGLGQVIPATGGVTVLGIMNEAINASQSDFAVTRQTSIVEKMPNAEFFIPVSAGVATAAMVGSSFDVDPANPDSIDVSGAGTDILVTEFISATQVVGKIN